MSRKRTALGFGGWNLDELEARRLFSVYTISGNSDPNTIIVYPTLVTGQLEYTVDGGTAVDFYPGDYDGVSIAAGDGDDTIQFDAPAGYNGKDLTFDLGAGNDWLDIIHAHFDFDGARTVNAGDGNDRITVYGFGDAGIDNCVMNLGAGDDTVESYVGFESSTINGQAGNDKLELFGITTADFIESANEDITFNGGDGNDTVDAGILGDTGTVEELFNIDNITFNGDGDYDSLYLYDDQYQGYGTSGPNGTDTYYSLTDDHFSIDAHPGIADPGRGNIDYGTIEYLSLSMQSDVLPEVFPVATDHPTLIVDSTPANVYVSIHAGYGNAHLEGDPAVTVADRSRIIVNETGSNAPVHLNTNAPDAVSDVTVGDGEGTSAKLIFEGNYPLGGEGYGDFPADDYGRKVRTPGPPFSDAGRPDGMQIDSLAIDSDGIAMLNMPSDAALRTNSLGIASGGQFDIGGEAVIIDYTGTSPLLTSGGIFDLIHSGYDSGAWDGSGINSSIAAANEGTAVGYAESTDIFGSFPATFAGQAIDSTSILLKFTFAGDADLDFDVDGNDIAKWAVNFTGDLGGLGTETWVQGDWNYDRSVDGIDAGLWAVNFTGDLGLGY